MAKIIVTIVLVLATIGLVAKNSGSQQTSLSITPEEAVSKVKGRPEVKSYLQRVPGSRVDKAGDEGEVYLIQVYEIKDGHTATFNWYRVDKKTGEVKSD